MAVLDKTLFSFEYPEVMATTCVTGWTYIPCPTWSRPGRMCRQDIVLPCVKTRRSRFRVYAYLRYPDTFEDVVRSEIERCHLIAAGVATNIVYAAATASSVVGPQATIAAAVGAIPPALEAYIQSFWNCLTSLNLSDVVRRQFEADIKQETVRITDWS
ncbi:hypothetical protein LI071_07040 [Bacillus subtilis]|uniref:hypothetical protein n=1 Tax=Bacillus subtilis TaxID=1423 RepID=UPI001D082617|nr:hypothetical protein [Bacillus subtilis]MCB7160419.1 hypothetical protein [Bacillus subtilis]MCB7458583.1 hypothetical protein [Bacillus subtilis]